jgi:sugar phosphate isomerase/epimerase
VRLSCGNDSFPVLPHDLSVRLIAALGFQGYDLSIAEELSQVRLRDVLRDISRAAGQLEERVRGQGLVFSDVFYVPNHDFQTMAPNHPDPLERARGREEFMEILRLAVLLEAPGMTMLPGIEWVGESHDDSLTRAAEELGHRVALAGEHGVRLSVEPHIGSLCRSPEDVERLCEMTPGLELTLDYTHYVAQGYSEAELEPLLARARHFHARGGDAKRLQAPLKESTIDYERAVVALRDRGYDGFVAVEYCWVDWQGLDEVDVLSETIMMRDRLLAAFAGEPWAHPGAVGPSGSPSLARTHDV